MRLGFKLRVLNNERKLKAKNDRRKTFWDQRNTLKLAFLNFVIHALFIFEINSQFKSSSNGKKRKRFLINYRQRFKTFFYVFLKRLILS